MRTYRYRAYFHKSSLKYNGDFMLYSPAVQSDTGTNRERFSAAPAGENGCSWNEFWINVHAWAGRVTVMEYTTLYDAGKMEICDGDILSDGFSTFTVAWDHRFGHWGTSSGGSLFYDLARMQLKIIGNIWQNPELLEGAPVPAVRTL